MNEYLTGATIRALHEAQHLTQAEFAAWLHISDKTVSKWETGRGYPDISLLPAIAGTFRVSVAELLAGQPVANTNVAANMLRTCFYICPVCGNIIHSTGQAAISCHGITLLPEEAESPGPAHEATLELVEDEYYLTIRHDMTRAHHIRFLAAVSSDRVQLVQLYPEGSASARFQRSGVMYFYYGCNRDGLFRLPAPRRSGTGK